MSCNVLHPQCWQQQRWIGAGGARNRHSGETLGGKAQIGLSRTAASADSAASLGRGCTRGAPALHLGTCGAATPPCTIGGHRAPPPDTRQPRAGSCCCFRQHRTVDLWTHRAARCTVPGVLRGATCRRQGLRTLVTCHTTAVTWRLPKHGRKGENLRAVGRSRRSRGASRMGHTGGAQCSCAVSGSRHP